MFTVKHVYGDMEDLLAAESVTFSNGKLNCFGVPSTQAHPTEQGQRVPRFGLASLHRGVAFVMNANGKTVAKYSLGAYPEA